jgi:hypothetical protein
LGRGHRRRADADRRSLDDAWLVGQTGCRADSLERPDREQRSADSKHQGHDAGSEAAVSLPASASVMESFQASGRQNETVAFLL